MDQKDISNKKTYKDKGGESHLDILERVKRILNKE